MKRLALLLSILLVASPVLADVAHLARGGKLSGKLQGVSITKDGEISELDAGEVASIELRDEGDDIVIKKDGDLIECVVKKVVIRTIGGKFTLERDKLSSVDLSMSKEERLAKEYKKRRAAIKVNDVEGHLKLAQWCEEQGMAEEMRLEYHSCLLAAPDDERAEKWHKLAGDVRYNGEWMSRKQAQAAELKDKRAKGMVKHNGEWIDQKKLDRLQANADKIKARLEEGERYIKDNYKAARQKLKTDYEAELEPLNDEMEALQNEIDRLNDRIREERRRNSGDRRSSGPLPSNSGTIAKYAREKSKASRKYKKLKSKKITLVRSTERAMAQIKSNTKSRLRKLANLKARFSTLLQENKIIDDARIEKAVSEAIGSD